MTDEAPRTTSDLDAIHAFAAVARRFCALTASGAPAARDLAVALTELHLAALSLPEVDVQEHAPEAADPPRPRLDLPLDYYWDHLEPFAMESDRLGIGSFHDDIGDIHLDLARALDAYDRGYVLDACWHWRWGFHFHWGKHLVDAQRVLFLTMTNWYG